MIYNTEIDNMASKIRAGVHIPQPRPPINADRFYFRFHHLNLACLIGSCSTAYAYDS